MYFLIYDVRMFTYAQLFLCVHEPLHMHAGVCGWGGGGGRGVLMEHAHTHLLITILALGLRQTSAVQYCLQGKSQSLSAIVCPLCYCKCLTNPNP